MQAINRWRNWKPTGEKFSDSLKPELTKRPKPTSVSFVSAIPGQTQNFSCSDGTLAHDPAAWAEDFHRWALSCCVWRERDFEGIGVLHTYFGKWAEAHESVPCTRQVFEDLLRDAGLFFADGLVYGLLLAPDAKPGCILHPDVLHGEKSDPPDIVPTVDLRRSRTKP